MLHSAHEYVILRQYEPTRVGLEQGAIVHRGLAELRPRRISSAKLAAATVRQLASRSAQALSGATVIAPAPPAESLDAMTLLIDLPSVTMTAAVFPALLAQLHTGSGRRVLVALGEGEATKAEAHAQLARSLAAQSPQTEQRLAQSFYEALTHVQGEIVPAGSERKRLVVEERPGKATLLNMTEPTLRLATKRWQALASRSPGDVLRAPVEASEGWGIAALALTDLPLEGGLEGLRPMTFASVSLRLAGEVINLDTGRILRDLANTWLMELAGFGVTGLRRLVIASPWLAVAATLRSSFGAPSGLNPLVTYPDFLHGWQPFLTAVEFLCHPDVPAVFIYTGRYPDVHMMAVW